ncbi:hypothetical protein BD311DRAFT_664316 [Dichomitus squalens]|uniref:Uncharacterized protein n=1 Tax=Dichomitus squalens TaxID=114155 RepID=A0A4Q9MP51_9APHY|nr:hypothetical protein BD311DRAFT_664316 [Dichomitus squalens]
MPCSASCSCPIQLRFHILASKEPPTMPKRLRACSASSIALKLSSVLRAAAGASGHYQVSTLRLWLWLLPRPAPPGFPCAEYRFAHAIAAILVHHARLAAGPRWSQPRVCILHPKHTPDACSCPPPSYPLQPVPCPQFSRSYRSAGTRRSHTHDTPAHSCS